MGFDRAALVADEALAEAVLDHARVALVAADLVAAGAADGEGRVAAAVEEEERLLAGGEALADRGGEGAGDPAPGLGRVLAQVDRAHLGQLGHPEALGEVEPGVLAGVGVRPAFERGGGGGEDDGGAFDGGAQDGHVAGVVEGAVLLLVGAVVLLVDDDEAEVGEGEEERRAGADDEAGVAARHRHPGAAAGGLGDAGVPLGRAGAEAGLDAVEELDREGDLGEEDEGLAAAGEGLGDGLEVDLGLAGAGDALEERRGVAPGGDGGAEGGGGARLRRRERARVGAWVERRIGRVARGILAREDALGLEALDHGGRDAGELGELCGREAEVAVVGEGGEDARPRVGHPVGRAVGPAQHRPRGRRRPEAGRPGGEAEHHRQRREGIVGRTRQELAHGRRHRRRVEHAGHVAELVRVEARAFAPDEAEEPAGAERHLDEVAGAHAARGRAVVERPVEAALDHHRDRGSGREDPR